MRIDNLPLQQVSERQVIGLSKAQAAEIIKWYMQTFFYPDYNIEVVWDSYNYSVITTRKVDAINPDPEPHIVKPSASEVEVDFET